MTHTMKTVVGCALAALVALTSAQAGTFKTITIDDDYSDWAGVPVLDSDPLDNPNGPDVADVQLANDDDFLYMRVTYHTSLAVSTFIALDTDDNAATGYDIFGLGLIGSEAAWQNDFPFTQSTGVFNNGFGMSGDFFGSGAALIAPFGDYMQHELAISLDITFNETGNPVFDDDSFTILLWSDGGDNGEATAPISYRLAVPEPSSVLLIGLALLGLRRR